MAPETRHHLLGELQSVRLASRQLSRAIGEAKQTGANVTALIDQKKRFSIRERALLDLISAPASNTPTVLQVAESSTSSSLLPVQDTASTRPLDSDDLGAITVTLASSADWSDWDCFIEHHPGASVYHLSGWRMVIQKSFGHDCPYLLARRSGRIVGVMPLVRMQSRLFGHFMVSLPYFNYGGALSDDAAADQALIRRAIELASAAGCQHMEWRERQHRPGFPARTEKTNMWLDLPADADSLWQRLGSKLRAQIKKAQASGLTYETGGLALLDDFYRVFATNMRDLGTPVYGKRFFELILREAPGSPVLIVGRTPDGRAVSAALLLKHNTRMEVPWASTLRRANALNANMGLYWHMLSHACQASCKVFDFGRSTRDAATYRFKKQWGAMPVDSHWNYWIPDGAALPKLSPDNPKYRTAIAVWKQLPVFLTQWIGPLVVKSLP